MLCMLCFVCYVGYSLFITNYISKKADDISAEASYEETGGETVIIKSGSEQDVDVETESGENGTTVFTGTSGGGDSEVGDLLYKGG